MNPLLLVFCEFSGNAQPTALIAVIDFNVNLLTTSPSILDRCNTPDILVSCRKSCW
jgi:hypothetical protein